MNSRHIKSGTTRERVRHCNKGKSFKTKKKSHSRSKSPSAKKTWFGGIYFTDQVFSEEVGHFLEWLAVSLALDRSILSKCFRTVLYLTHVQRHKGKKQVVLIMKEMKLCVLRVLSEVPLSRDNIKYVKLRYNGIPSRLYDLIDLIRGGKEEIRFLLSFLTISRSIILEPRVDVSTIVEHGQPFEVPRTELKSFLHTCSNICRKKDLNLFKRPKFKNFHLSTKTGPLGVSTLSGCFRELKLLPETLRQSIYTLGGSVLQDHMEQILLHIEDIERVFPVLEEINHSSSFRRISYFSDPDGKTRVIALGDYWSQTALKPVHDHVYKILKNIHQDQTFDQGEGLEDLARLRDTEFHCYDLTAFTDRYPLSLIVEFLTIWYGKDVAGAIYDIFVGYPFDLEGQKITYNVGNPMGFYASWGLTTLLHHFIVYWACQNLNENWTKAQYKLLGDDIIIWNRDLALEYRRLIQSIGVSLSEHKSIVGKPLFEFAKRVYYKGEQVSPISFLSWKTSRTSISGIIDMYHETIERGVNIPDSSETWVLTNFFNLSKIYSKKRKRLLSGKLTRMIKFLVAFSQFRRAKIGGAKLLGELLAPIPSQLHWSSERSCKQVLMKYFAVKLQAVLESFQSDMSERIISLFMLLGNWTPSYSSTDSQDSVPVEPVDKSEVVYSIPHSYIVGQFIEQPYLKAQKNIRDVTLDPTIVELLESELKLVALNFTLKPKVKTYGRANLMRRISLASSAKKLYTYLEADKVKIYQEIVNSLPLSTFVKR